MSSNKRIESVLKKIKEAGLLDTEFLNGLSVEETELIQSIYSNQLVDECLELLNDLDLDEEWEMFREKITDTEKKDSAVWKIDASEEWSSFKERAINTERKRKFIGNEFIKYAAVILLLFAVTYFLLLRAPSNEPIANKDVITLKLDNGEIRVIEQGNNQQIKASTGEIIGNQEGDKIRYDSNTDVETLVHNELMVPYGKVFNLELSDGTVVYLNSGTTIKYPVKFVGDTSREVYLKGEAFFEVAKNKERPFMVHTDAIEVKVLGTEFNVSAYDIDLETATVVVEGSVEVRNPAHNKAAILLPGLKSGWNKDLKELTVDTVNTQIYTSWMNGELVFRKATLTEILHQLERKYNVEIENNMEERKEIRYNARFNIKIESIEDAMKVLAQLHPMEWEIKDRKVIIH